VTTDAPSIYQKCRTDVASMLGYDLDALTPEQALRLDVATSLRVLLDSQSGRLLRGESLDARELLMASDALAKILPPLREPPPAINAPDPRQIMLETYMAMRKRGEFADPTSTYEGRMREIERLKARVAELELAFAGPAPAGDAPPPAAPPAPSNVVPLSRTPAAPAAPPKPEPPRPLRIGEQWDPVRGFRPIPPQPNAAPPSTAPSPPPAAASGYDYDRDQSWRDYVEPTGEIRSTPRGSGKDWGVV
jgi:hypothetical protein